MRQYSKMKKLRYQNTGGIMKVSGFQLSMNLITSQFVKFILVLTLLLSCGVNGRPGPEPNVGVAIGSFASTIARMLEEAAVNLLTGGGALDGRSAFPMEAEHESSMKPPGTDPAPTKPPESSGESDGGLLLSKPPLQTPVKANVTTTPPSEDKMSNAAFRQFLELLIEKIDEGKPVATATVEASAQLRLGDDNGDDDEDDDEEDSVPTKSHVEAEIMGPMEGTKNGTSGTHVEVHLEKAKKQEKPTSLVAEKTAANKSTDLGGAALLGLPKHSSATQLQPLNDPTMRAARKVGESGEDAKVAGGSKESVNEKYAKYLAVTSQSQKPEGQPGEICNGKHDNCVTDVKVVCDAQVVTVMIQFARPFQGLVRLGNPFSDCVVYWPGQNPQQTVVVTVAAETCPSATGYRARDFVTTERHRVQVQFDQDTSTYEDVNFLAHCAPGDNYAKQLEMRYTVLDSAPVRDLLQRTTGKTSFEVAILRGFSPYGPPLSGEIQIGAPLTVSLKVRAPNAKYLDLKILSCWASFGEPSQKYSNFKRTYMANNKKMGEPMLEVVRNGCSLRSNVFGNFVRLNPSPSATQPQKDGGKDYYDENMVFHAPFRAFRFAESDTVRLQCKVVVCYGKCPGDNRPCPPASVESGHDVGQTGMKDSYPQPSGSPYKRPDDKVRLTARSTAIDDGLLKQHAESVAQSNGQSPSTAEMPERPKRGAAIVEAGLIRFLVAEDEGKGGASPASGYFTSASTIVDFGKAVVWAKCALPDQVIVTLNDPTGFTGEIIIEQASAVPPTWFELNHQYQQRMLDENRVKRQGLVQPLPMPPPMHMVGPWHHPLPPAHPPCSASSRETFHNAYEATVLRKMDCITQGTYGNKLDMKFVVKINSASGLSKVAVLDCRRKFFVLE